MFRILERILTRELLYSAVQREGRTWPGRKAAAPLPRTGSRPRLASDGSAAGPHGYKTKPTHPRDATHFAAVLFARLSFIPLLTRTAPRG